MELKEKLLDSHFAFEEQSEVNDTIQDYRSVALKVFEKKGFPTKKIEAWKYTSLEQLINKNYTLFPKTTPAIELKDVKPYFLDDIDTYKIIFVDGVYSPFLSETTHDKIETKAIKSIFKEINYTCR